MSVDTLIHLKFHGTPEAVKSLRVTDFASHLEGRTELISIAAVLSNLPEQGRVQITHGISRKCIVSITAPGNWFYQPWVSKTADDLLVEVSTSLMRVGLQFDKNYANAIGSKSLTGSWRGWRNFSSRSSSRSSGEATNGSVLSNTLDVLQDEMPNYANWIDEIVFLPGSKRILEIGAGTGTMSLLLASHAELVAFEPSKDAFNILQRASGEGEKFRAVQNIEDLSKFSPFDQILLINVLEHVDDDCSLLLTAKELLRDGGTLTVLSPAHNSLYSKFDASIGHVRRYTKTSLAKRFQLTGFQNIESRYFNSIGAILWFMSNRLLGTMTATKFVTNLYDRIVVPISKLTDKIPKRPFGQSVIVTGQK
jgi:SAM-dependent methyltransferase